MKVQMIRKSQEKLLWQLLLSNVFDELDLINFVCLSSNKFNNFVVLVHF